MSDDTNKTPIDGQDSDAEKLPKNGVIEDKEMNTAEEIGKNDIPYAIETIMHNAYLQYSLSVNVGRAIPDVRDGLKPGNRRILYAMRQRGFGKSSPYAKCAKVVGEVIGNYHPHGDTAVYETLVRMAQEFSMRCPLIDGQGNFGSIDGDSPAAYRYTECRMERLAEEMLADLDKDTVDMRPTFDDKDIEPSVLPARFPNLLVNGAQGIGVGMATSIPPHNLGEVINATVAIIDNPRISIRELMRYIPAPDFPTGGIIQGIRKIIALYETGHGSVRLRGKARIEEKKNHEQIIITEIPYAVNKESMVLKIAELVTDGRITGISGIEDLSSSRVGIKIVIDIKRGHVGNVILNQIYSMTQMETVIGCQFLVVDRNRPRLLNLKQVLEAYIDHREEVITRRTRFELAKAEKRDHIVQGLMIAQANINEVVEIIKQAPNRQEAANRLMERFELSELQTKAILEMRLYQLTNLAVDELKVEHDALQMEITRLKELLSSRIHIMGVVKQELIEVRDKYADARRTLIIPGEIGMDMEDMIARKICVIPLSNTGYIKRVAADVYEAQNRGGKGVRGMRTKAEDFVEKLLTCCTHDYILFFTNKGRMHWKKGYEIPECPRDSQGKALVNFLELENDERVQTMIGVPEVNDPERFVVMVTKNGIIKKTALAAFRHLRKKGIIAINLADDDALIDVALTDGNQDILLSAANGRACRFLESDIRPIGRQGAGVHGMNIRNNDKEQITEIVDMTIVQPENELLVISKNGMGKRTPIGAGEAQAIEDVDEDSENENSDENEDGITQKKESGTKRYRRTRRGARGVISMRLRKGDKVVAALKVSPEKDQEVLLMSVQGQTVRIRVQDINVTGRAATGVIIMRLSEGDEVATATIVDELSEEERAANKAKAVEDEEFATRTAEFQAGINEAAEKSQAKEDAEEEAENQEAEKSSEENTDEPEQ
ncbi:MAG: DNA gyrase subunit A [Lentisphaeria bacterium]